MWLFLTAPGDRSLSLERRRHHAITIVVSIRHLGSQDRDANPFNLVVMFKGSTKNYTLLSCDSCFNRDDVIGYPRNAHLFIHISM